MTQNEAKSVKTKRSQGYEMPLNKERDKRYHND
jgi:hypothetical protein